MDQYTLGDLRDWAEARSVDVSIRILLGKFQVEFRHESGALVAVRKDTLGDAITLAQDIWDE